MNLSFVEGVTERALKLCQKYELLERSRKVFFVFMMYCYKD